MRERGRLEWKNGQNTERAHSRVSERTTGQSDRAWKADTRVRVQRKEALGGEGKPIFEGAHADCLLGFLKATQEASGFWEGT